MLTLQQMAERKRKMLGWRKLGISDAEIGRRIGKSREWVGQQLGRKNGKAKP
jgi:DNA-binding CsgD family transcriptional regulator